MSFDPTPAVIGADASARPSHRTSASSGRSGMAKAASTAAAEAGQGRSRQPAGESSTLQQRLAQLFGADEPPVSLWALPAELDEGSSSASHRAQDHPMHLRRAACVPTNTSLRWASLAQKSMTSFTTRSAKSKVPAMVMCSCLI